MGKLEKKKVLRVTNGTIDDLSARPAADPAAKNAKSKGRVKKQPVYTGDDPVKKAYYARKGTMKVRTGRGVVPVAKVAVTAKKGKGAKQEAGPKHQAASGSKSVLTTGRIG